MVFTFENKGIAGGASFALSNEGIKFWCASTSSTATHIFERYYHSPQGFVQLMHRSPREREALFIFQRPGDLTLPSRSIR